MKDVIFAAKAKDCFNTSLVGDNSELIFNSIATLGAVNVRSSYFVLDSSNIDYSEQIVSSQDLFGCNGLRRKKYCILNKQYSKDDYVALRAKIIENMKVNGEWGKFFPKELSCFGYNEATGQRYFPLDKEEALAQGFQWRDEDEKFYQPQIYEVPDNVQSVPNLITNEVLGCGTCEKNFKITSKELQFYKKLNIPVPCLCHDCRHKLRMSLRNPFKLWDGKCARCSADVQTTYTPDSPEKTYCEQCYLKEVY